MFSIIESTRIDSVPSSSSILKTAIFTANSKFFLKITFDLDRKMSTNDSNKSKGLAEGNPANEVLANSWMIRQCELYIDEYKECTSYAGRFHQKYTTGDTKDCSKWKEDYNNCLLFRSSKDPVHAMKVIENELTRRNERLENARNNDVWEYRTSPPPEWSRPLPEHLTEKHMPKVDMSSNTTCAIS